MMSDSSSATERFLQLPEPVRVSILRHEGRVDRAHIAEVREKLGYTAVQNVFAYFVSTERPLPSGAANSRGSLAGVYATLIENAYDALDDWWQNVPSDDRVRLAESDCSADVLNELLPRFDGAVLQILDRAGLSGDDVIRIAPDFVKARCT